MLKRLIIMTLTLLSLSVQATPVTQVNRYATIVNKPLPAQINPLLAVQQVHFPQSVATINDAVHYWLRYSGFKLSRQSKLPTDLLIVLSQPLPQVDRSLGPLSIADGLGVLVGEKEFSLITDPIFREINFKKRIKLNGGVI